MATSDKPGKPAESGTARSGGSRASPRRKASRPPIIDIAATEAPQDEDGKTHGRKPAAASPEAEAAGGAQASAAEEAAARRDPSTGPAATGGKASSGAGNPEPGRHGSPETAPRAGRPAESPGFSLTAVGGAAAAGALLCLAVLVGLDRAGVLPWRAGPADGVDPAAIEARIASLESRLSGLTARTEPSGGDLAGRVAGIEENLRAAGEAVGALPGLIEKLDRRLSGFETSLSQTRTTAQTALSGLETIETAVNTIGERAGEAAPSAEALELKLSALSARLDRMASERRDGSAGGPARRIDALEESIGGIKAATERLDNRIEALTGRVAAIPEGVTPGAFGKARGAMEKRLDAIETRLGGPGEMRGAASAIALAGLRRIIDRGQPFQAELAAFSSLVHGDPVVSVLKPHARTGLRTRARLLAGFRSAAEASRKAAGDTSRAQDLTGVILSRLHKVVQVKRAGDGGDAGDSGGAGAVAARMGEAVGAGDLDGAVARGAEASEALPVPLKTWIDAATARLAADRAMGEAEARMLAALARSGG